MLEDLPPDSEPWSLRVHDRSEGMLEEEISAGALSSAVRPSCCRAPVGTAMDAERLARLVPDTPDRQIFICGAPAPHRSDRTAASELGDRSNNLHAEDFAW
jgi:ferredoxin-NADP reductase